MQKYKWLFALLFTLSLSFVIHTHEGFAKGNGKWNWPVQGTVTDTFGARGGSHFGIDIAAPYGKKIRVVEDGIVAKSYFSGSYGNVIFVLHPDGYETVYAHMSKRFAKEGEQLKAGEVIGAVGNTGHSRGNHLHFEVHEGEWNVQKTLAVNPLELLIDEKEHVTVEAEIKSSAKGSDPEIVEVEKGDTLWGLAETYEVSIDELKGWNHLDSDLIVVGQELVVSDPTHNQTAEVRQEGQVGGHTEHSTVKKVTTGQSVEGSTTSMENGQTSGSEGSPSHKKLVASERENPLSLIVDIHS